MAGGEGNSAILGDCLYIMLPLSTVVIIILGALAFYRKPSGKFCQVDKVMKMNSLATVAFVNPIIEE